MNIGITLKFVPLIQACKMACADGNSSVPLSLREKCRHVTVPQFYQHCNICALLVCTDIITINDRILIFLLLLGL